MRGRVGVELFRRLNICWQIPKACDPERAPEECSVSVEELTDRVRPIVGIVAP